MILDIEMLRSFYASYSESVAQAKATVKRPLLMPRRCSLHIFSTQHSCDHIKEV